MNFSITDPSRILGADLGRTMRQAIHQATPTLRDKELERIRARTPDKSGALSQDETGDADTNVDSEVLVHLYTGTSSQLAEYHRVYAQYVEGPVIGPTLDGSVMGLGINGMWSNARWQEGFWGWHMFSSVWTEDADQITEWFTGSIQAGIDDLVGGKGLRI